MITAKTVYNILIVDDNPVNIDVLRHYLNLEHYQILAVTSGEKALKLAARVKPDIILLDVMMPGIDGYETCRRLKSSHETESIPVVFVTAKIEAEDIHLAFSVGGSDYITKPIQQDEVLARVANQLKLTERLQMERELVLESEKMSSLGGFVSSIAHEISTPLGTLNTALSYTVDQAREIQRDYENKTLKPAKLANFLSNLNEALHISQTNIENASMILHSFKLVAVDQCQYTISQFNLREYIDNVLLSLKPKLKNTDYKVTTSIAPEIELTSFPGAISQIVTNLINNSMMHGYPNEKKGLFELKAVAENGDTILTYTDDGCGIEADLVDKVFEPYYTTKARQGGSGLGMGIIKRLIEQDLRGTLNLSSVIGQGVEIVIKFPSSNPAADQDAD
jgi:CheY-like chemotaxis protein/two-component sensor histidine kinase